MIRAAHACALAALLFAMPAQAQESQDFAAFPKWRRVMAHEKLRAPLAPLDGPLLPLLEGIQARYRAIPYVEDMENYGAADYWATREEMQARGKGDCEDFAIAEMYDLLELGVPAERMHIVVVLTNATQEIHAYLQVGNYVLDRRAPRVLGVSEAMEHYTPIFRINRQGWERK